MLMIKSVIKIFNIRSKVISSIQKMSTNPVKPVMSRDNAESWIPDNTPASPQDQQLASSHEQQPDSPQDQQPALSYRNDENCIFCKIRDKTLQSNILYEDEKYLVFPDHKPASENHILVIPKNHIKNIRELAAPDVPMVEQMLHIGQKVLRETVPELEPELLQTGFHWPIHTVSHLHMHLIYPPPQGLISRIIFSSWFFKPVQTVIQQIKTQ